MRRALEGLIGLIGAIVIASVGPSIVSILVVGLVASGVITVMEFAAMRRGRGRAGRA